MRRCTPRRRSFYVGTLLIIFAILWTTPTRVYKSFVNPLVARFELSSFQLPRHTVTIKAPSPLRFGDVAPYSPQSIKIRSHIQGTSLRGGDVRRFWSLQNCFSETGQWVLDETPRAMCCKVKVYHTPNFTKCDYALRYCNASSTVVYGSPLPASVAAQIQSWTTDWAGRHLMISGDSISYQVFITFLNFLRSEVSETQYPFHGVGFEPVCGDVLGGEGFKLAWVCTPLLNTTWVTHYVEEWQIEILLINRGGWFRSDFSFVTELQELVKVLQARYPHLLVIYRNTPPGHKGCLDLHGPLKVAQEKGDLPYHWGEFARQNEMAKRIVHRAHFVFLDVDSMLSLRPDGHLGPRPGVLSDCLHYSIPGPLDVVFYLFYNTLLLL